MSTNNLENKEKELEKGQIHILVEIIEYIPKAVVTRTIIKKSSGNITAMSLAEGEELEEKSVPFDVFVQIIHGCAQVTINGVVQELALGSGLIIPANSRHRFDANEQFKMICTVIKSGYEDMTVPIL